MKPVVMEQRSAITRTLTVAEQIEIIRIGNLRNAGKHPSQSRRRSSEWTDAALDHLGVIGETVVAHALGATVDTAGYGSHGDEGFDLRVLGCKVAVKTNHRRGGYGIIEHRRDLRVADWIAFVDGPCVPPFPAGCICGGFGTIESEWRYVGWLPVRDFWRLAVEADWGLGVKWYVRQEQLWRPFALPVRS